MHQAGKFQDFRKKAIKALDSITNSKIWLMTTPHHLEKTDIYIENGETEF
jgi:hypothetical protein